MTLTVAPSRARHAHTIGVAAVTLVLTLMLSACSPPEADRNFTIVNELRASVGVAPLGRSGELDTKAQRQADRMASAGTIFHSKSLSSGVSRGWSNIGENVAMAGSIEDAQQALVNSPGHYANMTNGVYTEMGVGVVVRDGTVYLVQVFVAR